MISGRNNTENIKGKLMMIRRKDSELPYAVRKMGMKFHHIGIPTTEIRPGERYIDKYKFYVSGFETSEYGIEWMRFDMDSPLSQIIRTVPHIAFQVDNLDTAIHGKELIGEITSPSEGVRVAMIIENGAPVEFLEFNEVK